MENIKIIDKFFDEKEVNKIRDYLYSSNYTCNSCDRSNFNNINDPPFWRLDLTNCSYFSNYLKEIIENYFEKKFELKRVYVVGQTYEQTSNYHTDDSNEKTYTFCYYTNKNIVEKDEGLFYLKNKKDKECIIGIEPLENRGVFFPSTYIHRGTGYNRFNNELRLCIAWKFKEIMI